MEALHPFLRAGSCKTGLHRAGRKWLFDILHSMPEFAPAAFGYGTAGNHSSLVIQDATAERTDLSESSEKLSQPEAAQPFNVTVDSLGHAKKAQGQGTPELMQAVGRGDWCKHCRHNRPSPPRRAAGSHKEPECAHFPTGHGVRVCRYARTIRQFRISGSATSRDTVIQRSR